MNVRLSILKATTEKQSIELRGLFRTRTTREGIVKATKAAFSSQEGDLPNGYSQGEHGFVKNPLSFPRAPGIMLPWIGDVS
jgi:hypothetical protein